ncbi:MAG: hypothetical protein QGH85_02745 [Candidatus Pacebacteria bacterium]|jgi:hypothetical protein|nr:hypothetical protein [Parcubacteria group bacterium]MDP6249354.1 hypothetical protein [Candidatus Paceibacterota bacterium]MDP7159439.1 hypothetical protein [Candidatus Paceibacterota bacterium]MDP7366739.1 hypothetical protein [Candidatus Paceibacterota bacterium]MDP7466514.1 hypothetical protein [Candidatus Paceibacterota bacterium]|tara:strand:- start:2380 stop:2883 length:504 start_codon:yes stop_codon:yes gene_type:complete
MDIHSILITAHLVGVALGVGGATFVGILYMKAMKDGKIDPMEGEWLSVVFTVLRIGLVILVISGFGFFLEYRFTGQEERLLDPRLWAKMTIILVLVFNALLIQMRKVPMWLGESLSITSWYGALVLGIMQSAVYSYTTFLIYYIVAVFIVVGILKIIKRLYLGKQTA